MVAPSQSDPCGPGCQWCAGLERAIVQVRREVCEFDGHEWDDAGGGLLICMRCEAEKWEAA